MEVIPFSIDPKDVNKPFVRMAIGEGCGIIGCGYSPDYFVSISDGHTGLVASLSIEEMVKLLGTHSAG